MSADIETGVSKTCGVAVMAKASRPGLTKTRLIPALGAEGAARLNTAFLTDAAANMRAAGPRVRGYAAFGPPEARDLFGFLPAEIGLVEAWHADFGDTLMAAMTGVLAQGHAAACLVNSDSPTLPPALLADAAERLLSRRCDLVLGPADDGGYYLIGARTLHRDLFAGMTFSVDTVFAETVARAQRLGLSVHVLPPWYDVDDAASLATLRAELFEGRAYGAAEVSPGHAEATRALLAELGLVARAPIAAR